MSSILYFRTTPRTLAFVSLLSLPTPSLQPLTHLCQFHLQVVAVSDAAVKVGNLLCGGLDLEDDHDIGEDNDACGEDETEEQDGHDEALAGHGGLGQPPVQRAGGPEGLRGIASPADQGHGGPETCVQPHKGQAQEGVVAFQPCA